DERGEVILEHPANQHPFYNHRMLTEFWEYTPISQPAVFWKRDLWEACGPLRENLYFAMDYDLWMRMSRKTDFSLVDAYVARYRIHPDAKCFSDNYGSRIELIKVSRQYWPSRLKPRYWSLLFKYLFSKNSITQHYSDGQRYMDAAVNYLNAHKRLRAIACFCKAHFKHFRTPSLPGYRPVLKGVLAKGIGPRWFWRSGRRVFNFVFRRKIVRLVLYHSIGQSGSILLTAEAEGYKNPQFRFWGKKGSEISLLRDWESENIFQIHDPGRAMPEFGVHIRAGDKGDFINQAWTVIGP
ncbi:MAG: hypothetical protein JXA35_07690, partial [Deltaproteobacteria bacterium]|nr:hypothetical protein [Deltaproteobacteria bacterium]